MCFSPFLFVVRFGRNCVTETAMLAESFCWVFSSWSIMVWHAPALIVLFEGHKLPKNVPFVQCTVSAGIIKLTIRSGIRATWRTLSVTEAHTCVAVTGSWNVNGKLRKL